jgi:hypothetical protein
MQIDTYKINTLIDSLLIGNKTDENIAYLYDFLIKENYNLAIAQIRKHNNALLREAYSAYN